MRDDQPAKLQPAEELLGQYIPLHYHFHMLQDESRVGAFRQAIEALVRPGMNVLELGGGTGILSFFAARRGANVICVERNPALARKARQLLLANGVANQVRVIEADACDYLPPVRVDAVICEMLHVALLREKQLDVIESFKKRYTAAGFDGLPLFIPDSTMLAVQPIEFDFGFAGYMAPIPLFQAPDAAANRTRQLADLQPYSNISYDEPFAKQFDCQTDIRIAQAGRFNALRFLTQNLLAFRPGEIEPVTWPNQLLVVPASDPVPVQPGDSIRVAFDYKAGQSLETLSDSLTVHVVPVHSRRAA